VGGESRISRVNRIKRRIEHNYQQPRIARFLDGRNDCAGVARHDGKALGARRDEILDRRDLAVIVAVELARKSAQIKAQFLGFRLGTLPHLDEEGIALRLGDEADDVGSLCGASKEAGQRDARERYLEMLQRDHEFPPMKTNAGRPAYPTRAPFFPCAAVRGSKTPAGTSDRKSVV